MRYQVLLLPLFLVVAAATPVDHIEKRAGCNADNCYRALQAYQRTSNPTFCSAYLASPTTSPTALSTCSGTRLSSACRCAVTTTATTSTTHSTTSSTTTSTTSSTSSSTTSSTSSSSTSTTSSTTSSSSSSSSSSSTSSSISVSAPPCTSSTATPTVVLASPTAIIGVAGGNSPGDYDDFYYPLTLPFPITFYSITTSTIYVSINGFISLTADQPGPAYVNGPLPIYGATISSMPDTSVAAFWDDLYIFANTPQGIFYDTTGVAPARQLQIEWYTSHYQDSSQYYHFIMTFQESIPNSVVYSYYDVSDLGISATVGAQSQTDNMFSQYSLFTADIRPGTVLTYDPVTNTFIPLTTCT